jgi:hypothetical protein
MDVSSFRKKYDELQERISQQRQSSDVSALGLESLAAVGDAGTAAENDPVEEAMAVVRDRNEDPELRAVTLHAIAIEVGGREDLIDSVLALLRDTAEPAVLRLEALRILQTLNFSSPIFSTKRAEYMALLRELINAEDLTLRQRVLEILAQEMDEYAQRRLLEGLEDPSKALLPPEKAIQLLGYDVHAEHFPILRQMVMKPPSAAAKQEAIRLLAADPASQDLLAGILHDKKQSQATRRASALALQALSPQAFQEHARRIVLDEDENSDLRATSISALAHTMGQEALSQDTELTEKVERLQKHSSSKEVKRSAASYMSKENVPSE